MKVLIPKNKRGQAVTELVFLIPLLLMLGAGSIFIIYICSQGIKVQQAANLAARIQGQERIAGGLSGSTIQGDNGTFSGANGRLLGDPDLSNSPAMTDALLANLRAQKLQQAPAADTVYGEIQTAVKQFFTTSEILNLFVPAPDYGQAGESDSIKVFRVVTPPEIFGFKMQPLVLQGKAYGGEDPRAYGLPRWGSTSNFNNSKFWTQKDSNGNWVNLPRGQD
jgi:hypothetical protein